MRIERQIRWNVQSSPDICEQRRPRSACASAQSDQGLHCPLTESVDTVECNNGEQMPGRNFTHACDESESVHFFSRCGSSPFVLIRF